jgi:Fur family ferric uptake transcriptional regulator/Fur family peroxide stress response transcriptional regulator
MSRAIDHSQLEPSMDAEAWDAALAVALRERGQRVTSQRLVIHRALRELDRHATAEEVLLAVSDRLPGVSLPTVYATLDLFEELGIVRRVSAGGGPALYDPRADSHHHLVCLVCGRVEDLEGEIDLDPAMRAARRRSFSPRDAELVISGLCADCAKGD